MMIVIMSMVVMMVRAMSRGMRMLTTLALAGSRLPDLYLPVATCAEYDFPCDLAQALSWKNPHCFLFLLQFLTTVHQHIFGLNLLRIYFQWAGNVGWGDVEPQSSFEALFHNVFSCTLKVDLVSIVRHPAPPKVRRSDSCSPKKAIFRGSF